MEAQSLAKLIWNPLHLARTDFHRFVLVQPLIYHKCHELVWNFKDFLVPLQSSMYLSEKIVNSMY